jgi:Tol biopolymer transport system component
MRLAAVVPLSLLMAASAVASTGSGPRSQAEKIDEVAGNSTELNSADNDIQPNVRKDGREVVFSSNHAYPDAKGGQDIYVSTRASTDDPWSPPVNLGDAVNTSAGESRPSLSWDAHTLVFGRAPGPEGMSDISVSTR